LKCEVDSKTTDHRESQCVPNLCITMEKHVHLVMSKLSEVLARRPRHPEPFSPRPVFIIDSPVLFYNASSRRVLETSSSLLTVEQSTYNRIRRLTRICGVRTAPPCKEITSLLHEPMSRRRDRYTVRAVSLPDAGSKCAVALL
jgi:hypothetical protein